METENTISVRKLAKQYDVPASVVTCACAKSGLRGKREKDTLSYEEVGRISKRLHDVVVGIRESKRERQLSLDTTKMKVVIEFELKNQTGFYYETGKLNPKKLEMFLQEEIAEIAKKVILEQQDKTEIYTGGFSIGRRFIGSKCSGVVGTITITHPDSMKYS